MKTETKQIETIEDIKKEFLFERHYYSGKDTLWEFIETKIKKQKEQDKAIIEKLIKALQTYSFSCSDEVNSLLDKAQKHIK